jgi:hypothetical protein
LPSVSSSREFVQCGFFFLAGIIYSFVVLVARPAVFLVGCWLLLVFLLNYWVCDLSSSFAERHYTVSIQDMCMYILYRLMCVLSLKRMRDYEGNHTEIDKYYLLHCNCDNFKF